MRQCCCPQAGLCLYGNDIDESTSPIEARFLVISNCWRKKHLGVITNILIWWWSGRTCLDSCQAEAGKSRLPWSRGMILIGTSRFVDIESCMILIIFPGAQTWLWWKLYDPDCDILAFMEVWEMFVIVVVMAKAVILMVMVTTMLNQVILDQLKNGVSRRRVGLLSKGPFFQFAL